MKRIRRQRPTVKTKYFAFDGGLNLVDPPLSTPDGMLIGSRNYELLTRGGYKRIQGHERYDGQPSPSDADYWTLPFDAGMVAPDAAVQLIVGQTSLARACVSSIELTSGSWAGNDAAGNLVIFRLSGDFIDNEPIVSGSFAFTIGSDSGFE